MANRSILIKDVTSHPVTSYINSLTAISSKRSMLSALKTVLGAALDEPPQNIDPLSVYEFPWPTLTPDKLNALKSALLKRYSRAHASKCIAAVRGIMGACFDLNLIDADQLTRIERVKGIGVERHHKTGRRISDGEIMALARACANDSSPAGARDDAIIGLGYSQGPRISEITNLRLADYDMSTGDLTILGAKGGKSRVIRFTNSTKASIDEWCALRGNEPGPLICPVDKAGKNHSNGNESDGNWEDAKKASFGSRS